MLYYATRISDNIRKREPEGYLICVNVPIARSGTQKYLPEEVDQDGDEMVTVYRPEEEVFSETTMASFEGLPVTDDHPDGDEGVTAENAKWLSRGHVQNVHRGTGDEKNMLIADLFITDPDTIQKVLDGKREISCGYNYELCEEDGKLVQRQIRGNHIAIVDKGRAGHRVCIKDSAPNNERRNHRMRKNKHGILAKMLASFAKDAEPEEVAEAVEAIDEIVSEPEKEEPKAMDAEVTEKLDTITDLLQKMPTQKAATEEDEDEDEEEAQDPAAKPAVDEDKLDKVISLLEKLVAKQLLDEAPEEDPLQKLEDELAEGEEKTEEAETDADEEADPDEEELVAPDEDPEEPESHFVDPEEINEEDEDEEEALAAENKTAPVTDKRARDAMRAAVKAVKPLIAKLPPSERKAAADAAAASIRKSCGMTAKAKRNDYLALKQRKKASDKAAAQRKAEADLGKRIMAARNANYKK